MSEPLLQVSDLKVQFRTDDPSTSSGRALVPAVDGISFSVNKGGALAIVGESGSGKSVSMLALMGLLPTPPAVVSGGPAIFEGKDMLALPESERRKQRGDRLAMIFQDPMTALNPFLTISRQLTEVLEVHRAMSPAEAKKAAIEMLGRVGIPDPAKRIDQYPHQFSGGMRQRAMIAMALLCRPSLLIADEPTTALDVTIQAQILELLSDLRTSFGTAVILITHDLGVVAGFAEQVCVMYAGRIVERGTVQEIFERPQHPYTQGLLRSVPRLDVGAKEALIPIGGAPPDPSRLPSGCPFRLRCPKAIERCAKEYPAFRTVSSTQEAACHVVAP